MTVYLLQVVNAVYHCTLCDAPHDYADERFDLHRDLRAGHVELVYREPENQ